MKRETYFTQKNIKRVAGRLKASLYRMRRPPAFEFDAQSAGLLVIDMQEYFLNPHSHAYIPSARAIIENVKGLIRIFLEKHLPVVLTRHIDHTDAGMMKRWWGELITAKEPMSKIIDELKVSGVKVIKKSQYDAFFRTGLEDYLKRRGVLQLVITGVLTHLCCDTTARSAFMRGFTVFFPVDGTATQNYQFHTASLLALTHGFVIPVLCGEIYEKVSFL